MLGEARIARAGLLDIRQKLDAGERLTLQDGVRLFECPDTLALGWLANREREKRHGGRTFYNHNIRLEATNVCVANCLFCSFARLMPGDKDAYTLSLEQALHKLRVARPRADHRSPRRQRPAPGPAVRLLHVAAARVEGDQARHPPEVLHGGGDRVLCRSLRDDRRAGAARVDGGGPGFAAGRRRRGVRRPACGGRSARTSAARIAGSRSTARPTASACART